jgi:polysaccharide biosynthesis/export protein
VILEMTPMTMNEMNDTNYMKLMKGIAIVASIVMLLVGQLSAQGTATSTQGTKPPPQTATAPKPQGGKPVVPPPVLTVEPDYRIGVGDVLTVSVWREDTASGDVVVRPDGKITPKMMGDLFVMGLTTDDVKKLVEDGLKSSFTDGVPAIQISVKAINSRKVYITGAVNKPGEYPLIGPMNINQLITTAGGLVEFANKKKVLLIRGSLKDKNGQPVTLFINYEDLQKGKNVQRNNPELMPGDQVLVSGG